MPTGAVGEREAAGEANGCCGGNLESAREAKQFVVAFPNPTGWPPGKVFVNPDPNASTNA